MEVHGEQKRALVRLSVGLGFVAVLQVFYL